MAANKIGIQQNKFAPAYARLPPQMTAKNSDNQQAQFSTNGAQQMVQNFSNSIEKMISNAEVLVLNFQP
jgi:hypothetical protein